MTLKGLAFNPNRTLTVMFANICACTIHSYDDPDCWQMRRQGQMVRQWTQLSDKVWIYNYNYTMLVNKGTLTPMVHRIRRNIPLLKEWGVIGFHDQDEADWAMSGIPARLVRAALQWNVKTDVDALLGDFYARWFGAAAGPMKDYYDALESAFEQAPQHGHEDVILPTIYALDLVARLANAMRAAEAAAKTDAERAHVAIERLIFDHLREYVALESAKRAGDFKAASGHAGKMIEMQAAMNRITPFMGWHPYPVYDVVWERDRMARLAAMTDGREGRLIALLPERARFRTDPFDDGRFERWQDAPADGPAWRDLAITSGWDTQGLQDRQGHPYRGAAWYQFEMDLPEAPAGGPVSLHVPAIVSEAWVWINGRYAGRLPYKLPWFRPQALDLDVTRIVLPGQRNRITLRVLCNIDVWGAMGIYERGFLYSPSPAGRRE